MHPKVFITNEIIANIADAGGRGEALARPLGQGQG